MSFLLLCFLLAAPADFTGKWNMTATTPGGREIKFEMSVRDEGGKLSCELTSERGSMAVEQPVISGEELSFSIQPDGSPVRVKLARSGGDVKGSYTTADGETGGLTGKKAVAGSSIAGTWRLVAKRPSGADFYGKLDLKEESGKWTGTLASEEGDAFPLTEVRVQGSECTFVVSTPEGSFNCKVTIEGNAGKGSYKAGEGTSYEFSVSR
jgi:hypothetical protein